MSNLRSDCRDLIKNLPAGDKWKVHIFALCMQIDQIEEFWHGAATGKFVLENAIRKHRDQKGDDRCWMDDEELYRMLPEGYEPGKRDTSVELANCQRFMACRQNPKTEYVSPQREIDRLRDELQKIREAQA